MLSILLTLLISYILLFLFSLKIKDNSIVDVFWGFGFVLIALVSLFQWEMNISQIVLTSLICLWWARIVSHIGFRKLKERKEDPRYAKWREEWGSGWYFIIRSFLQVYILQMLLMLVVAIPILVVNIPVIPANAGIHVFDAGFRDKPGMTEQLLLIIGALIALAWLIFETISDGQLGEFIKTKKPGQIFITGLYRYSRHPNYFWESMFWLGISLIALPYSWMGMIGWIAITFLLLFVSWVPLQEVRYAGKPEWEEYKSRTSVFVPWWPWK
jgi:steroid 5-alpha reductase family enzyme